MSWIKRLFGKRKTGVPKMENKPEPPKQIKVLSAKQINDIAKGAVLNVTTGIMTNRNAKGQFIKVIPKPYINRDKSGKFKSKEPKCPTFKKNLGFGEPKEGECTCEHNRRVTTFIKTD